MKKIKADINIMQFPGGYIRIGDLILLGNTKFGLLISKPIWLLKLFNKNFRFHITSNPKYKNWFFYKKVVGTATIDNNKIVMATTIYFLNTKVLTLIKSMSSKPD